MSPEQFADDSARRAAHGRWFRIHSAHSTIYRALQLSAALSADEIALDWAARHALEGGHAGAGAQVLAVRLRIRPARVYEYPLCLARHPNPVTRLGGIAAAAVLLLGLCALAAAVGVGLSRRDPAPPVPLRVTAEPSVKGPEDFLRVIAGDWRTGDEALSIRNDRGIVEVLRQSRTADSQIQLEQLAAAPVAYHVEQRALELATPAGLWRLSLIPGERRARLAISYPDRREVIYE